MSFEKSNPANADLKYGADQEFLARCRPKLDQLENLRLEKFALFKWRKKLAVPVAAVMTPVLGIVDYMLIQWQSSNDDTFAGLTVVALGGLWGWVTSPKRQYARAYKSDILPEIARLMGNFTYDVKGKIPMSEMKPSKIIPSHTSYRSEDYFSGRYKGVGIRFSEIRLTKKKGKSTVTVFDGLAVFLHHGARKFHGHTILTKDKSGLTGAERRKWSGLKRANLVDLEFERLFDVYTSDQVEARYLIDPVIMENIKALYDEYHGNSLLAAFYEGRVLIMIASSKNHFEPAHIDVPATNKRELLALRNEVSQILTIIDRLALFDPTKARRAAQKGQSNQPPATRLF